MTFKMYLLAASVSFVRELPAVGLDTPAPSYRLTRISAVARLARRLMILTSI